MNFLTNTFSIIFWFIVILIPIVIIHEFGHFSMARLFKVKIPEFAVGFPLTRRWFYKKWKGTIWSFYPIVIGGFVRIWGDSDALDEAYDTNKTDPKRATQEYSKNRIPEIISNKELKFFLEENSLEYDAEWQEFENSKFAKGVESKNEANKIEKYQKLLSQLETLAQWELSTNLKSKNAFFNKTWLQQTIIILGGIIFNLISGILLFWIMFGVTGSVSVPKILGYQTTQIERYMNINYKNKDPKILSVQKDGYADKIGLKPNDELISFAGKKVSEITNFDDFRNLVKSNKNKDVEVIYKKSENSEITTKSFKLEEKNGETLFGIGGLGYEVTYKAKSFVDGFLGAVVFTYENIVLNVKGLGDTLTALLPQTKDKSALEMVGGPIAIGFISSKIFNAYGASGILYLMGAISVALAFFNLLPLPALDGGRLVLISLSKITGKRNKKFEAIAISSTMILLLGLTLLIAFKDVGSIISGKFTN